jgi:hypothetical protein
MKYFATGRILPERANAVLPFIGHSIPDIGTIEMYCDASQINMTLELLPHVTMGEHSAFILLKNHARIIASCVGFATGSNYTAELVSITGPENKPAVYGVRIDELRVGNDIITDTKIMCEMLQFCGNNFFMRFAIQDYTTAITNEVDLPFLCYRAIETVSNYFRTEESVMGAKDEKKKAWQKMHKELGTKKEEIDEIKHEADKLRHGSYHELSVSTLENRVRFLKITREVLLRFKERFESKHS